MVERGTVNPKVHGSSPCDGAIPVLLESAKRACSLVWWSVWLITRWPSVQIRPGPLLMMSGYTRNGSGGALSGTPFGFRTHPMHPHGRRGANGLRSRMDNSDGLPELRTISENGPSTRHWSTFRPTSKCKMHCIMTYASAWKIARSASCGLLGRLCTFRCVADLLWMLHSNAVRVTSEGPRGCAYGRELHTKTER